MFVSSHKFEVRIVRVEKPGPIQSRNMALEWCVNAVFGKNPTITYFI